MPPEDDGWAVKPDYGDVAEMTRMEHRGLTKGERGRKRAMAEGKAELEAAGFEVGDAFAEPDLPEIPDPYDIDGIIKLSEELEERSEKMQKELELRLLWWRLPIKVNA